MTLPVAINGKFLSAKTSGIIRVANTILREMNSRLQSEPELRRQYDFELLAPPGIKGPTDLEYIPLRHVGRLSGQPWEQLEFPYYAAGRVALNFTPTGPVFKRDCVSVVHDAQMFRVPESFPWKQRLLHQVLTPLNGHLHRRIVTVSNFSRSDIERYRITGKGKAQVIHNAAEHVLGLETDPSLLDELGLTGRKYILANAYAQPHKNVGLLFKAMALLDRPGVELVLFGGVERALFEQRGIDVGRAIFAGRVSDGGLRALFEHATVFAFPSTTEGFGLPPLEAMSLGCPTIVSDAGAMPEVCRDGATYADPNDPAMWARKFAMLLDNPELQQRLRQRGPEVAAEYSWKRAAQSYFDVLDTMRAA